MLSERRSCLQHCYLAQSEAFGGAVSKFTLFQTVPNEICTLSAFKFIIDLKNKFKNMKAPLSFSPASKESFWFDYSKYTWPLTSE